MGLTKEEQVGPLGALFNVERSEWGRVLLSGGFFFCVLFGVLMLRPAREAMGVEGGVDRLRTLFLWTAGVSLVVAVIFGGLVSRLDRRKFIPIGFRVVMACLVVFACVRVFGDETSRTRAGVAFYVWFSVFNMFVTSVFWAYMADIWRLGEAKRLYPIIGVGGTLGGLLGASVPWQIGEQLGDNGPAVLMVGAIVLFEIGVRIMRALDQRVVHEQRAGDEPAPTRAIGGTMLDGLSHIARSWYLIGISAYIALIGVTSTVIYFASAELVVDMEDEIAGRLPLFAQLDTLKQLATLLLQLFVTSRLIRAIGVGGTLCVLPVVTVAGFLAVWLAGRGSDGLVWMTFAVFQGLHGACRYAFVRPARETLFSVVPRGEKYKAKTVVDMFVFRAGDVAGLGVERGLALAGVAGFLSLSAAMTPLAGVWAGLAISLGVMQKRRAKKAVDQRAPEVGGGGVHSQGV